MDVTTIFVALAAASSAGLPPRERERALYVIAFIALKLGAAIPVEPDKVAALVVAVGKWAYTGQTQGAAEPVFKHPDFSVPEHLR